MPHAGSRWLRSWAAASLLAAACQAPADVSTPPPALPATEVQATQVLQEQGRSEVERLLAEEHARLLAVEQQQAHWAAELERRRELTRERRDFTLGWQRRIRERKAASDADSSTLDPLYDDSLRALRSASRELANALARPAAAVAPRAGADPLNGLEAEARTAEVRSLRARLEGEAQRLEALAWGIDSEERAQIAQELDTLNRERLGLLPYLSAVKRGQIMGFTAQGLEQAGAEIEHLMLVARYHRRAFRDRLRELAEPGREPPQTIGQLTLLFGEVLLLLAIFFAWRRLARAFLTAKLATVRMRERRVGLGALRRGDRLLELLARMRGRVSWLVLWVALFAILPPGLRALRGIQLLDSALTWLLGGALAVTAVNALAGGRRPGDVAAALRLRSLRLVGGVVITFGLTLTLCSRQLGHGTVYSWVFSGCWFSAVPIFLILVGWWRGQIFQRLDSQTKKNALERWILHGRSGYQSYLAAMVGAVCLFGSGSLRAVRRWLVGFDLTRRGLAYLFRRELGKLSAEHAGSAAALEPLDDATYDRLGPSTLSAEYLPIELELSLVQRAQAMRAQRGGVLAVVSERGMGKTTALARLRELVGEDALSIAIGTAPLRELQEGLRARLSLPETATLEEAAAGLDTPGAPTALLLDDAQRLIQPLVGGLRDFDAVLAAARTHSKRCTWVFAFNEAVWPFLRRARGACPSFDEVLRITAWREAEIAQLIQARSAALSITPSFEYLLDEVSARGDEIDRQLALTDRANGYYRLIWDYAGGNPGVALDIWRRALGVNPSGRVFVRLFPSLSTAALDRLPDPAAFVLRAILQLAPASAREIARATLLSADEVGDALRYSLRQGFVCQLQDRYQVTWTWLRPISRFLQRKHLWVAS